MKRRNFQSSENIFKQGEPADRAFLLVEGEVAFFQGRDRILDVGRGRFFGDLQLFKNGSYPATAVTLEPSIVIEFTAEELLDHLGSDREALKNYLTDVEDRVEELLEMLIKWKAAK
jgi:CRP-like cAMP-binding protein